LFPVPLFLHSSSLSFLFLFHFLWELLIAMVQNSTNNVYGVSGSVCLWSVAMSDFRVVLQKSHGKMSGCPKVAGAFPPTCLGTGDSIVLQHICKFRMKYTDLSRSIVIGQPGVIASVCRFSPMDRKNP
jgi:hypothetical protein